jgi:urease gamma subunit
MEMSNQSQLNSYSTIFALGHKAVQPLLEVPLLCEEKVDGSQFSFGKIDGQLVMRSKGARVFAGQGEMFEAACGMEADIGYIPEGMVFRCEYLSKPRHNILRYERIPAKHLIVFDVEDGRGNFLSYSDKQQVAANIGLETVPRLYEGMVTLDIVQELLDRESVLGGTKIEGVVLKPVKYDLWGTDKKVLMGKYVSEMFKEKHAVEWKSDNKPDVVTLLAAELRNEARWQKAIQHLAEAGRLENSPRDIGPLIKEVIADVEKEEVEYVKQRLFARFWPEIRKQLTFGLPEWYKDKLLKEAFSGNHSDSQSSTV